MDPIYLSMLMDKDTNEILEAEVTDSIDMGASRRLRRLDHSQRSTKLTFFKKDSEAEPFKQTFPEQWT